MKLTIQQLQRTKQIGDDKFDEYFLKSTKTLIEQIDNLSKIAGTFSNFAKMPEAKFQEVNVCEKLHSVVELFSNNNENIGIHFNCSEIKALVLADPEQLVQVFNNLLKNAIQAIPEDKKGEINVTLLVNNKMVEISIADNGTGIEEEVADKLFLPNFTTKTTGMGLGLAISKNIIEITEGTITFETKKDQGTTFKICLPCLNC
jgi:two-component system, NtrC family, nitrogen regulation sensor histidine kinase NtrY